jgi:hypothetical protein
MSRLIRHLPPSVWPRARGFGAGLFASEPPLRFGVRGGGSTTPARHSVRVRSMMTISITTEASAAIEAAFPGDWRNEIRPDGKGGYLLTLPEGMIDLPEAIRTRRESYSDVILRLAKAA